MRPLHLTALRTAIFGMLAYNLAKLAILAFIYSVFLMTAGSLAAPLFVVTGMLTMVLTVAATQETARGLAAVR